MKVFISYAHDDQSFVERLDGELTKHSIDAWYDRKPGVGLRGGETWENRLELELCTSDSIIVVLSPSATQNNSFVSNEYQYALKKNARVIPIFYQDCEVPLALTKFQYVDFVNHGFDSALTQLLSALDAGDTVTPPIKRISKAATQKRKNLEPKSPARVKSLRCVSCGKTHSDESEVLRCEKCGRAFCKSQDIDLSEETSSVTRTPLGGFSSSFGSTRISLGFATSCGVTKSALDSRGKKVYHYLCTKHAN